MSAGHGWKPPDGVRVTSDELSAGRYRIYARRLDPPRAPRGVAVVVHGMVVAGRGTLPLAGALAGRGFVVHLPDLPGFGRSAKPRRALDVDGLGGALAAWADRVVTSPVVLVGNSFGCQVAAAAAERAETASAVVLVAPTVDLRFRRGWAARLPAGRPGGPPRRGVLGSLQRRLVQRLVPDQPAPPDLALGRLIASEYVAAGPARALSTYRHALRDDLRDRVRRIDAPLLVVRGASDRLVSSSWADTVAAAGAGSAVEVAGVDHDGQFHRPESLADAVVGALDGASLGPD